MGRAQAGSYGRRDPAHDRREDASMTRAKWTATLMLSVTFVVGALSGMALEEAAGIDWFDFLDDDESSVSDLRLIAGLDLTADQRATVDRILERQEDQLEDYWEE